MTPRQEGAWGHGLATLAGDTVLDTWYPEPRLGAGPPGPPPDGLAAAAGEDPRRGVRSVPVLTEIGSLADPPADAQDAYLRLHLLSHRLIRPHEADLTGIFGVLPNVAWTDPRPGPAGRPARGADALPRRRRAARGHVDRQVPAHDGLRRPAAACGSPTPTASGSAPISPRARP